MPATYALLLSAVLALWCGTPEHASRPRRFLWLAFFSGSLAAALATGIVQPIGLTWIAGFAIATFVFARPVLPRWQRAAAGAIILLLAAGLVSHRLPGFNNPRVISAVRLSADAVPYSLHLNFDKTLVGLFILGFCHQRIARAADWRPMLASAAPIAAGCIALLMVLSLAIGHVRFEPKLPPQTWLWLGVNLLFTCVAEEALFRGFVQAQLARAGQNLPRGEGLALLVGAILFGAAHLAGGLAYVGLATIAGMGYGWVYLRTGRIEASILTHFALNTVHFLGFTYPALQKSM